MHWVLPLLCGLLASFAATAVDFTPEEHSRILSHGPWPVVPERDAGNRVDGNAAAIELGQKLFSDRRLSGSGRRSCAGCHDPKRAFQDGRRDSRHQRNTPTLLDSGRLRWFGWDGSADSLWAASLQPLTAAGELATTPDTALALLKRDADLRFLYESLFGKASADELLLINFAKSLAAYQATLVSPRTAFDEFRDALAAGNSAAATKYPESAQRGLKLFVGEGKCFFCHSGPTFTNGEFADIGRPFFTVNGADPGRWGGLQLLLKSPYNRLGKFSDTGADAAIATKHVLVEPRNFGEFKVPTLRGLSSTAPYFHDGSARTIGDVVRHYSTLDETRLHADGERILRALKLTTAEQHDLAAFLLSLNAPR
jgi:cytochrome c peroxidase